MCFFEDALLELLSESYLAIFAEVILAGVSNVSNSVAVLDVLRDWLEVLFFLGQVAAYFG